MFDNYTTVVKGFAEKVEHAHKHPGIPGVSRELSDFERHRQSLSALRFSQAVDLGASLFVGHLSGADNPQIDEAYFFLDTDFYLEVGEEVFHKRTPQHSGMNDDVKESFVKQLTEYLQQQVTDYEIITN